MTPTQILRELARLDRAVTKKRDEYTSTEGTGGHAVWLAYHAASCALDAAVSAVHAAANVPGEGEEVGQ